MKWDCQCFCWANIGGKKIRDPLAVYFITCKANEGESAVCPATANCAQVTARYSSQECVVL